MPTRTTAAPKDAATSDAKLAGYVAIGWNPDRDVRRTLGRQPREGLANAPTFQFAVILQKETEETRVVQQLQMAAAGVTRSLEEIRPIPQFHTITLQPGLNWGVNSVSRELWEEAKRQSTQRYEEALAKGRSAGVEIFDEIADYFEQDALVEFAPKTGVDSPDGTFDHYEPKEIRRMLRLVTERDWLHNALAGITDPMATELVKARIKEIDRGRRS